MRDQLNRFVSDYSKESKLPFNNSAFGKYVRNEIPKAIISACNLDEQRYKVDGSAGQGNWAKVPWIGIFDRSITTSATKGVYIVYLLSTDTERLYITFNQGCTDLKNQFGKKEAVSRMRNKAREIVETIDDHGFNSDENVNLGSNLTELGDLYQKGVIFYKEYQSSALPSEEEMREDLNKMIEIYDEYAEAVGGKDAMRKTLTATTKTYSWEILGYNDARKRCDKSFFQYRGSTIPQDVLWFFNADDLGLSNRIDLVLDYKDSRYTAYIQKADNRVGQVRIFWESSLAEQFASFENAESQKVLEFHRTGNNQFKVELKDAPENVWLLSWNRDYFPWPEFSEVCESVKKGTYYEDEWTCNSTKPKVGDDVFLLKLGSQPRGIVGHGKVIKESFLRDHYLAEKADEGVKEKAIEVKYDCLLNYENGMILPQGDLKAKCGAQTWSPMSSGVHIQEEVLSTLWGLWNSTLSGEVIDIEPDYQESKTMKTTTHNFILYGPPGTGKTYHTVEMAVGICDGLTENELHNAGHAALLRRYDELVDEGRILFTTFHQSYGYEEFIEGIRPVMESENASGELKYEIRDGIFKQICKAAETPDNPDIDHNASIWFVRLKDGTSNDLKHECFDDNVIRFNAPENIIESDRWLYDRISSMKPGDFVVSYGGTESIDAVGIVDGDECYFDKEKSSYNWTLNVKWLIKNVSIDVRGINNNKYLPNFQIAAMKHMRLSDLLRVVEQNGGIKYSKNDKPYVLIIDEINRGNISKIFGELITLIEDTKRSGASEAMEAILPYSGERFSVPDNVYILGTMNTADRSIALMDTALRRRFTFIEKMPDSSVLDQLGASTITENGETLNVSKTLDLINERIEYLYDREHTIGHAYFTELAERKTVAHLGEIFEKRIIPLLQEYFYDDFEKIQLVLGDNQKSDDSLKIVLDKRVKEKDLFNGNPDVGLTETTYDIQLDALQKIETYKEIGEDL